MKPQPSVELLGLDLAATDMLLLSAAEFERRHHIRLGDYEDSVSDLAESARRALTERGLEPMWWRYLAIETSVRRVVGWCGFKGPPSKEGVVELVCGVYPGFEGQGYTSSMAKQLVKIAVRAGAKRVIAYTRPKANESTRLLRNLGFVLQEGETEAKPGSGWTWEHTPSG